MCFFSKDNCERLMHSTVRVGIALTFGVITGGMLELLKEDEGNVNHPIEELSDKLWQHSLMVSVATLVTYGMISKCLKRCWPSNSERNDSMRQVLTGSSARYGRYGSV